MERSNYKKGHEIKIRRVLNRLGLWDNLNERLPGPEIIKSGVAGHSCLYFIFLPYNEDTGRYIVAKFDLKIRRELEWKALNYLKKRNNPPEIIMPLNGNCPDDGMIIFDAVDGISGFRTCSTLLEYLDSQATYNKRNCVLALHKTFQILDTYYNVEPGAPRFSSSSGLLKWDKVFPSLKPSAKKTKKTILKNASIYFPDISWGSQEQIAIPISNTNSLQIPNPFLPLDNMIAKNTGSVMLSRIHGDLNLTNIIVSTYENMSIDKTFIIDFTNCEPSRVQAFDFSRVEVEITRNIISKYNAKNYDFLLNYILVRDYLDGRIDQLPSKIKPIFKSFATILGCLRKFASKRLNPDRGDNYQYFMADYFHCLYFHSINTLKHKTILSSQNTCQLLVLCASLSLKYIQELNLGMYANGSLENRWHPIRNDNSCEEFIQNIKGYKSDKSTDRYTDNLYIINGGSNVYNEAFKIDRLSQIAYQDAGWIGDDNSQQNRKSIKLDQNLYVNRKIEKEIHSFLQGNENVDVENLLIVGDAGYGKTSLLWKIYDSYQHSGDWEIIFLKSTFLFQKVKSTNDKRLRPSGVDLTELQSTITFLQKKNKNILVLIDTIDLLLHDDHNRNNLYQILLMLNELDCYVIATTRPQEASLISSITHKRIDLFDYDNSELYEAIYKHSKRFYIDNKSIEIEKHVDRINNAVSSGRPIREVCTNPLTLRMLFTLYAPEEVPLEVNVFRLYSDYWESRVRKDKRAGQAIPIINDENMGKYASLIALAMSAEGSPEIDKDMVIETFSTVSNLSQGIETLIRRNVIHHSETNSLRFFHQTFFEHCAARGFLKVFRIDGLSILKERLKDRPNDLFLTPILEHLLLLCENGPYHIRDHAENLVCEYLKTDNLQRNISAIWVYGHKKKVNNDIRSALTGLLQNGQVTIIKRFLEIVPNINKSRLNDLFIELEIVWKREIWVEQQHILELLVRLSLLYPKEVSNFIKNKDIIENFNKTPSLGINSILELTFNINKNVNIWNEKEIIDRLIKLIPKVRKNGFFISITKTLIDITNYWKDNYILLNANPYLELIKGADGIEVSKTIGELIYLGWKIQEFKLEKVINELHSDNRCYYKGKLYGFSKYLTMDYDGDLNQIWKLYTNINDIQNQWLWANIVIQQMLKGDDTGETNISSNQITDYFKNKARDVLNLYLNHINNQNCKNNYTNLKIIFSQLIISIKQAELDYISLFSILDIREKENINVWLNTDQIGIFLVDCFLGGMPEAKNAMNYAFKNSNLIDRKMKSCVAGDFATKKINDKKLKEKVIIFLIEISDGIRLNKFIEINSIDNNNISKSINGRIFDFCKKSIKSRSSLKRRSGYAIWSILLKENMAVQPTLNELVQLFGSESDLLVKAAIVKIVSQFAGKFNFDLEMTIDFLEPLTKEKDVNLRDNAVKGIAELFISIEEPSKLVLRALDISLIPPTNSEILGNFGYAIEKTADLDIKLSLELFLKLISSEQTNKLTKNAKRQLIHRMRKPTRKLLSNINKDECKKILNFVPKLDEKLGRIIIDAICHVRFAEIANYFESLLNNEETPFEIKQLILWHKHRRERTVGSEGWPSLWNHLQNNLNYFQESVTLS